MGCCVSKRPQESFKASTPAQISPKKAGYQSLEDAQPKLILNHQEPHPVENTTTFPKSKMQEPHLFETKIEKIPPRKLPDPVSGAKTEEPKDISIADEKINFNETSKPKAKDRPSVKDVPYAEKKIFYNFKKVGFSKCDELLAKASKLLATAERVREGVEDSKQEMIHLSNTFTLKEQSFAEVVQVLLWAVSANCKGKIRKTGIQVYSGPPFIHLPKLTNMMEDAQNLYDAFSRYIKAVVEGSDAIQNAEMTLEKIIEQIKTEYNEAQRAIIESNKIEEEEKKKFIKRLGRYTNDYLPEELQKIKRIAPLVQNEMEELKDIGPNLKDLFNNADEVGVKVYEEYTNQIKNNTDSGFNGDVEFILSPVRIFNTYCLKEKKDQVEIEGYIASRKDIKEENERALDLRKLEEK